MTAPTGVSFTPAAIITCDDCSGRLLRPSHLDLYQFPYDLVRVINKMLFIHHVLFIYYLLF